jgi:hypothetical protein
MPVVSEERERQNSEAYQIGRSVLKLDKIMWKSDYAQVKGTFIFLFDLNITLHFLRSWRQNFLAYLRT